MTKIKLKVFTKGNNIFEHEKFQYIFSTKLVFSRHFVETFIFKGTTVFEAGINFARATLAHELDELLFNTTQYYPIK